MRNNPHYCSGYRAIHWSPSLLERSNNLQRPSLLNVVRVAAVISYFTARSIHLKKESSKLLLLAPHNDTIDDLEGLMGAAAPDYPQPFTTFTLHASTDRTFSLTILISSNLPTTKEPPLLQSHKRLAPLPFTSSSRLIPHFNQPFNLEPRCPPSSTLR